MSVGCLVVWLFDGWMDVVFDIDYCDVFCRRLMVVWLCGWLDG